MKCFLLYKNRSTLQTGHVSKDECIPFMVDEAETPCDGDAEQVLCVFKRAV